MRRPAFLLVPALAGAVEVEAAKLATADAMPVEPGAYEISLGASWTRSRTAFDDDGKRTDRGGMLIERQFEAGLTAGLVEDLDAGITCGWASVNDDVIDPDHGSGPTDIALGAKWRFFSRDGCALALIPELSLPIGDGKPADEISTGSNLWGASLALAASATFDRLALGAALDGSWVTGSDRDRGDARGCIAGGLAVGWQLTEVAQPEAELQYHRDLNAGDTPDAWLLTATVGILVSTDLGRFGAGLDQALAGRNADRSSTIQVQWIKGF